MNLGISLNYSDKFRAEFNYSRSDWRDSGMDYAKGFSIGDAEQPFVNSVKESYRLGMEYVPNLNDVRYYYRRIAYRAGAYYNNEYYAVAGQNKHSRHNFRNDPSRIPLVQRLVHHRTPEEGDLSQAVWYARTL